MSRAIIGYIRVSTKKQRRSGLGIEAQREALARFATRIAELGVLPRVVEGWLGAISNSTQSIVTLAESTIWRGPPGMRKAIDLWEQTLKGVLQLSKAA